ncbi:gluconokinase [Sphaerotilus microaerophilus]|uniref:Gluconokinase n=1 Tax=Sphaerotilus microaerophilus TaxID=2914710 RepID=A0ABN6PWA2_9BURK|nr:gluconokinase [Sphaerotilus sp. FB-5]BDI07872.1 gluconokinase [Sphaerotilus sp. FB-5]
MNDSLVIMGVSGCGKSSLAAAVAEAEGLPLVEGDAHHSEASREKMRAGVALTDADRAGWLERLAAELCAHPQGCVLACSALRRSYRDVLRSASPGLRFAFLDIAPEEAQARVAARSAHFFSPRLVDNQFATLESPLGEPRVRRLDATAPLSRLQTEVSTWLHTEEPA